MSFTTYMKETLESGDPVVRNFALVDSNYLPVLLSLLYVFFVKRLGPTLMESRKPFDLRILMILYNFAIVFIYLSTISVLIVTFLTTDSYKGICAPISVSRSNYTYSAARAGWIIYLVKYIEFADTIFLVLRKKNHLITHLHVIHHASLPVIGWIIFRSERSGFQFIPAFINSIVHIIMYTYYGLAAMGPEVQKHLWWKEYLTKFQMLQFVVILLFVLIGIPLSGCKTSKHGLYMDLFFALLFLGLFYNFYTKTYKTPPAEKRKNLLLNKHDANGNTNASLSDEWQKNGYRSNVNGNCSNLNGNCSKDFGNNSMKNGNFLKVFGNSSMENGDCSKDLGNGPMKNGNCSKDYENSSDHHEKSS